MNSSEKLFSFYRADHGRLSEKRKWLEQDKSDAKYSYIQHGHRIFSKAGNKRFDPAVIA
jgi:hypothetical protein